MKSRLLVLLALVAPGVPVRAAAPPPPKAPAKPAVKAPAKPAVKPAPPAVRSGANSPFGIAGLKPRYGRELPELWDVVWELGNYMEDAGIRWDRAEIAWGDVQSAPDRWDWTFTDRMMAEYRKRPINAYVLLEEKAPWMAAPPRTDEERQQYATFVYNVVNRYKGTVKAWEIWNEQNIPTFWPEPNARDYALLLRAAYEAAKRADPSCTIITGGTSTVDLGYIRRVLHEHGGWAFCDAVAIHPYSMGGGPDSQGLAELIRMTRAVATRDGVRKPVWITEVGWTTDTTRESELRQAEFLVQEYAVAIAEGVAKVFWFTLGDWGERWGLIAGRKNVPDWGYTSTNRAKPAYYALKYLATTLSPTGKRPAFLGYLPNTGTATVMAFLADGDPKRPVALAWTPFGESRAVAFGQASGLYARNAHGKSVPVAGGRLAATEAPVIVTGFQPGALKTASPRWDPARRAPGRNLVVNPSMERPDRENVAFWNRGRFPDASRQGTMEWLREGRTGARALGVRNATDGAWHSVPIAVWAGKTYTLRAWARPADATGENRAILMWYSGNLWTWLSQDVTESVTGTGAWREVTVKATAPADAVIARLVLMSKDNTGSVAWDDVTLTEE